ncbi:MAG: hypothetical protein FWG03_00425 [Clostridiales bacterium]|nr:hypothetical protein [Clostridiales bacterium]
MKIIIISVICIVLAAILLPAASVYAAENVDLQTVAQTDQLSRTPYNFSDHGTAGESFSHKVTADVDGLMTLEVSGLGDATASVTIMADDGRRIFSEVITGSNSRDLWVTPGEYTVAVRINETAGEVDIGLSVLMPSAPATIGEDPLPLAGISYDGRGDWIGYLLVAAISALLALTLFYIKGKLVALKKPMF